MMVATVPPGRFTNPQQRLTFSFEGRTISAAAGQSIAAALYAAGVRIFTRSFKYHRPRGLLCVSGDCPNCLMQVDGRPNVRTCIEPARPGQVVRSQNCWPSLNFDLLRTFDRLDYFLPVGFYYKSFHKPRWVWPIFEHMVRHIAGLGKVDVHAVPDADTEVEHIHTEVCVVGGGPAGLAAAAAAAEAGVGVVLLDRQPELGGHLLFDGNRLQEVGPLLASLRSRPNVRIISDAAAFGLYEGNLLGAFVGNRFLRIRAFQIIIATGGRQRPWLFHNNDLPGIMLGQGVLRLARLHGVRAGRRAVVLTDNDAGHRLAEQLMGLRIEVLAVVDPRQTGAASKGPWKTLAAHNAIRAEGSRQLKGIRVGRVNAKGIVEPGTEQDIGCDLLCVAPELVPANELLHQAGIRFKYHEGRWQPDRSLPGILAAGAAAGTFGLETQILEGRLRGLEAAAALGQPCAPPKDQLARLEQLKDECRSCPLAACQTQYRKRFVCMCEDVTVKDIQQAIDEGFDGIETLKRYATVGMGPCQGKMCGQTSTEVCAVTTKKEIGQVGTTTSRPPMVPVEMAVLAADRRHQPVRRTPLHHWHQARGCKWMDAGQWKRPDNYGSPEEEVKAVRSSAGLIDVSTLGKFEILGPDAGALLDRISLGKWSDMKVGKVRYAAMCNEDGILFDDGIGGCVAPNRYYLTASTGNAEAVYQWLELWRTVWRLDATILNRTSSLAGMNLAGPHSREVLGKLTEMDLASTAFPYPALRDGEVAGIPCRLLRIGFVGELGYEIHCPSSQALHLWEAIMEAGSAYAIKPFGVEAQRIMRLEKGHLIVGQDSDALSNPFEAGLEWLIRFEKPEFHGREPLLKIKEMGRRSRLVGFHLEETTKIEGGNAWARQLEGCQVVEQGRPAGRITSSRFSPTLKKYLGLAWVPESCSADGKRFSIRAFDSNLTAVVVPVPFYDPESKQLKV